MFIRFLEDKLIEEKEIANFIDRQMAWDLFASYCKKLEPRYNGLIFKPHPVIDSEKFNAPDEKIFREICEGLAGRESPYNFDQIPISILGSIYERFLGKVVHATAKQAKVEDKPEVRKAGGVYYTPDYIVRYIVKETVGKLIEGRSPEEISKMAFADIACGSGSFLIEVYDTLLKYHERYYAEHPDKTKKGDTDQRDGRKVLSLKKRQEILVNNIYGVDIDYQATEVTQLSLYLKLLEDVTTNEAFQFSLLKEKILPNLNRNIVCGDSLIGTAIVDGDLFASVDESKLKPMNFEDAFPEVMKPRQKDGGRGGGFDAVVGNPPWIDIKGIDPKIVDYYFKVYSTVKNRMNVYAVFLQRGLSLLRRSGKMGYITPSSYTTQSSYAKLRRLILKEHNVLDLVRLPDYVFKGVVAETIVSIMEGEKSQENQVRVSVYEATAKIDRVDSGLLHTTMLIPQSSWEADSDCKMNLFADENSRKLIENIAEGRNKLIELCDFSLGLTPYDKYKGHTKRQIEDRVFHSMSKKNSTFKPLLSGENITRYYVKWDGKEWISYGDWLGAPREQRFFTDERILVRQIVSGTPLKIYAGYTKEELYNTQIAFNILLRKGTNLSIKYILAILNSSLMNFYHRSRYLDQSKNVFQKILIENAKQFPIAYVDKTCHDHIVQLVERMLAAKEELSKAKTEAEMTRLECECEALDRQIDQCVYQLAVYPAHGGRLTEEEIKVVEKV